MNKTIENNQESFAENFDRVTDSDRFYLYLSKARIPKDKKIEYSKSKWSDIPKDIRYKILRGFYC